MKNFNIFKTFEKFNSESINILKDRIIEIILIETENIFSKPNKNLFEMDFKKNNSIQISIFNDKKTFDLLSNTWKRHKNKQLLTENDKNNQSTIFNQQP